MPTDGELAYSPSKAAKAIKFFERVLVHTKGRWARAPFVLTDWQREDIIKPIFGVVRWDAQLGEWVRSYNEVWLELARKNGKSELMAGIALYMTAADGEESAEVYGAAKDKDQAALVFNVAKRMVELSPILSRELKVVESRRRIVHPATNSVYQVIPGDAEGNLGQDPSCILFDEIIAQPSRDLYDTLRTAFGSRSEPLLVCATNAGNDPESFAKLEHDEALKVAEDASRQPNRYVYARNTPEDADPWDEANWRFANPALGDFLNVATLRAEAAAARQDPTKENSFRQYRLSQWVQSVTRAIQIHRWDEGAGIVVPEELEGRKCFAGLDLAATTDLAALMLLFPPTPEELEADTQSPGEWQPGDRLPAGYQVIGRYWVPEGAVEALDKGTGGKLSVWEREGRVQIMEGDVIDYEPIWEELARVNSRFGLLDVNLDPWNAATTIKWCERNRIEAVPIAQTFRALSPPTKEFRKLVKERRIRHGGDPVLRWNIDALELKRDHADNERPIKPNRNASSKRVDGAVALIMALDGAIRRGDTRQSAYEDRGLDVV